MLLINCSQRVPGKAWWLRDSFQQCNAVRKRSHDHEINLEQAILIDWQLGVYLSKRRIKKVSMREAGRSGTTQVTGCDWMIMAKDPRSLKKKVSAKIYSTSKLIHTKLYQSHLILATY